MKFRARVIPSGNAMGVEIPPDVMAVLGPEARPAIAITINGHTWRSRVALMRGQCLIGISAADRTASGIAEGDLVEVAVVVDTEPRTVEEPLDLAAALNEDVGVREAFDRLPFGLKRKHVATIEEAKSPEVRQRRIEKLVSTLGLTER